MSAPHLQHIDARWWHPVNGEPELDIAFTDNEGVYRVRLTRRQAWELGWNLREQVAKWPTR